MNPIAELFTQILFALGAPQGNQATKGDRLPGVNDIYSPNMQQPHFRKGELRDNYGDPTLGTNIPGNNNPEEILPYSGGDGRAVQPYRMKHQPIPHR